jgi:hypothetical protein
MKKNEYYFDSWHESFSELIDNKIITDDFRNFPQRLLIYGNPHSGKSSLINRIQDKIYLNKKVKKIIVIRETQSGMVRVEKNDRSKKKNAIEEMILDSDMTTGITQLDIVLSLTRIMEKELKKKEFEFIIIEDFQVSFSTFQSEINKLIEKMENTKFIITTTQQEIVDIYNAPLSAYKFELFEIPKLNYEVYQKYISNNLRDVDNNNIFVRLNKLNNNVLVKKILDIGENQYGVVDKIIPIIDSVDLKEDILKESVLNLFISQENNEKLNYEKLLLCLVLYYPYNMNLKEFDYFNFSEEFDYDSILEKFLESKVLEGELTAFKISEIFGSENIKFLKAYTNKRIKREMIYTVLKLIKNKYPEDYLLRGNILSEIDVDEDDKNTYYLLAYLRNNRLPYVKENEIKYYNIFSKVRHGFLKNKPLTPSMMKGLSKIFYTEKQLLISSEAGYYYLLNLINDENRVENFQEIDRCLLGLIDRYNDLKAENEAELQIKIGLLLYPQLMNLLGGSKLKIARDIYFELKLKLSNLINKEYYEPYYWINEIKSSTILDYKEIFAKLYDLLESISMLKDKEKGFDVTYIKLILYTNYLGVSFYVDKKVPNKFKPEKMLLDGEVTNKKDFFKYLNNIFLYEIIENNNLKQIASYIKRLMPYSGKGVIKNNLAGLYFYQGKYDEARKLINDMMTKNINDDFYEFYGRYNLAIIDLVENSEISEKICQIDYFKCPSLFTDQKLVDALNLKIELFCMYLRNNRRNLSSVSIKNIEKIYANNNLEFEILKKAYLFTDYQCWV